MILVDPESVRAARIYADGSPMANRHLVFLVFLCGTSLSACSSHDPEPIDVPAKQTVSSTYIDTLLNEGGVANQQLAEQLVRQSRPFRGQLNLELDLAGTKLTDEQFKSFTLPDSLTQVDLTETQITDDGLAHLLSGKNIVEVKLIDTRITAKGLARLRAMPNLREVHLQNTDIPDREQQEFRRFLRNRPLNQAANRHH